MEFFNISDYFNLDQSDFDSPDEPDSREKMHPIFLAKLERARKLAAIPFKISSGYRSKKHNEKVGGVQGSAHTVGRAVDIISSTAEGKYKIVTALLHAGFTRIGIAKSFIHVDDDITKNIDRIWTY